MKTTEHAPEPEDVLTVDEVAELLHLHYNTIYEKANSGEIPGMFRIGEGERAPMRFSKRILLGWISSQATKP